MKRKSLRSLLRRLLFPILIGLVGSPAFAQVGTQSINAGAVTISRMKTTGTPSSTTWANGGDGNALAFLPLPAASTTAAGILQLAVDLGGTYTSPTVIGLQGRPVSASAPTSGQALVWNAAGGFWGPGTVASSYTLPIASATVLGGVKIPAGSNITEAADGSISVAAPGTGPAGAAATISVGTTTTLTAGSSATVMNSGTTSAATLNFGVPAGAAGAAGATGPAGPTGAAGTNGTNGTNGAAATVAVGTTTTGAAGTSASVTNSGTSSSATFNFTIPQGAAGATGATGPAGTYSVTSPLTLSGTTLGLSLGTGLTTSAGALTRTTTGTAGTYGDATHYPIVTTNAYGDVTGVTTQAVSGGSSGTVTSVSASSAYPGMTVTVTNPTTTPAIAHTATTGLTANQFVATPNGSAGAVALRSITPADLPAATTSALGAVQPDGTSVTISGSGVISAPGSGITQVSSDPTTPAVGVWWENTTTHTLKTKEPSGNYWGIQLVSQALGKPASGTAIDTGLSISSGIVLAFPLNEGTGTTATDRGTGATNGTLAASTMWASDATYTKCLTFSGSQTVTFPHSASDDLTTFTISTAFKSSATGTQVFYNYGGSGSYPISLCLQVSNGIVSALILNSSGSTLMQVSSGSAGLYDDGNWHSVICTYSTAAGSTLYVDSAAATTAAGTTTTVTSTNNTGLLGRRSDGAFFFTGSLGYVTLWNRILASGEVTTIKSDPFAPYR